jgi:hypothetical protein
MGIKLRIMFSDRRGIDPQQAPLLPVMPAKAGIQARGDTLPTHIGTWREVEPGFSPGKQTRQAGNTAASAKWIPA